jgi:hypothetical protein
MIDGSETVLRTDRSAAEASEPAAISAAVPNKAAVMCLSMKPSHV